MKTNELLEKCEKFSLFVIDLYTKLKKHKIGQILGMQLLNSGTSIGANVEEAQGAESKADFIHKISVAYKEARESGYWLRLIIKGKLMLFEEIDKVYKEREELVKILNSILKTSRKNI